MQRVTRSTVNKLCSFMSSKNITAGQTRLENNQPKTKDRLFVNEIQLVGRVGADAHERGTAKTIVYFPLVTKQFVRNKEDGSEKEFKDWHRIIISRDGLKKFALDNVTRGSRVLVNGRLSYRDGTQPYIEAQRILALRTPDRTGVTEAADKEDSDDDSNIREDDYELDESERKQN